MEQRSVIVKTLVVCVALAIAPWLSGGQEPLGMLISAFAVLTGTVLLWRQPVGRKLAWRPLTVGFWALTGFALLSLLWTANRYSTGLWVTQWLMAALVFRLTYAVATDLVGRKWLMNAFLISAGLFAVIAIGMYLTSEYGRLTGTFYWANPAAAYLIPAVLLVADRIRTNTGRVRLAWTAYLVMLAAAFLLTDSRAASAVLALVLTGYLIVVPNQRRFWIHLLFTMVAAFILSYGLVQLGSRLVQHSAKAVPGSRYSEAVKGESTSGSDRLYYLESAFDMWLSRPLAGVGAGTYGDVHPGYQHRVVSASTSAHNIYAQTLAELGVVGFILLLALILVLLVGSLFGLIKQPSLVALFFGLIGLLMHFGLDIDVRYPALLGLAAFLAGLQYTPWKEKWVGISWRLPLIAALVLVPVVSLYFSESSAERGRVAQSNEDYATAALYFGEAHSGVIYNPDYINAEGINLYVLSGVGAASSSDALARARLASSMDPRDGQHYQLEGRILLRQNDLRGAERAFRRALELDPYNHPAYALDLFGALIRLQRTDEAMKVANGMLALYPPQVVANRSGDETVAPALAGLEAARGEVYLSRGDLVAAQASAGRALELDKAGLRGRALMHRVEEVRSATQAHQ